MSQIQLKSSFQVERDISTRTLHLVLHAEVDESGFEIFFMNLFGCTAHEIGLLLSDNLWFAFSVMQALMEIEREKGDLAEVANYKTLYKSILTDLFLLRSKATDIAGFNIEGGDDCLALRNYLNYFHKKCEFSSPQSEEKIASSH